MRNVDLSREPRNWVRKALAEALGHEPSEDELQNYILGGTLTGRRCENPLCDWRLQRAQARFCTRCWKAIELCRSLDASRAP